MQKLPRSKGAPQIILAGPVWDRAADELERQANLQVKAPLELSDNSAGRVLSLRARNDRLHWGIVVCSDDAGAPDFTDNRYHVALAYLSNSHTDSPDAVVRVTAFPTGDPRRKIVTATNLFENNDRTHNVRPQTIVRVWADADAGSPPTLRWSMIVADEGADNAAPCAAGSSSSNSSTSSQSSASTSSTSSSGSSASSASSTSGSSGSGTSTSGSAFCTYVYHCDVTCDSAGPEVGPVIYDGSLCNPIPGQPVNQWFVSTGAPDISCRLLYNRVSTTPCATNGDCPDDDPNAPPAAPTSSDYATCCSMSAGGGHSSSSGSGNGVTQSVTVVTAFDHATCMVSTATLNFTNGLLTSVTD